MARGFAEVVAGEAGERLSEAGDCRVEEATGWAAGLSADNVSVDPRAKRSSKLNSLPC